MYFFKCKRCAILKTAGSSNVRFCKLYITGFVPDHLLLSAILDFLTKMPEFSYILGILKPKTKLIFNFYNLLGILTQFSFIGDMSMACLRLSFLLLTIYVSHLINNTSRTPSLIFELNFHEFSSFSAFACPLRFFSSNFKVFK